MDAIGSTDPTPQELQDGASRVEAFQCFLCQNRKRFPRFNSPIKLLETRDGFKYSMRGHFNFFFKIHI